MTLKRQIGIGWAATLFLGIIGLSGTGRSCADAAVAADAPDDADAAGRSSRSIDAEHAPGGDSPVVRRSAWRARNG